MKNLGSIAVKKVETLQPDTPIRDAASRMRRMDIGALPVCSDSRVIGMVTDRDIVVRAIAEGLDPERDPVSRIMTQEVISCTEDEDVAEAARLMEEHKVGRLVVTDREGRLKGILSLGNLTHLLGKERLAELIEDQFENKRNFAIAGAGLAAAAAIGSAVWYLKRSA